MILLTAPALELDLKPTSLVFTAHNPSSLVSRLEDSKVVFSSYIAAAALVGIVNVRELVLVRVSLSHKLCIFEGFF